MFLYKGSGQVKDVVNDNRSRTSVKNYVIRESSFDDVYLYGYSIFSRPRTLQGLLRDCINSASTSPSVQPRHPEILANSFKFASFACNDWQLPPSYDLNESDYQWIRSADGLKRYWISPSRITYLSYHFQLVLSCALPARPGPVLRTKTMSTVTRGPYFPWNFHDKNKHQDLLKISCAIPRKKNKYSRNLIETCWVKINPLQLSKMSGW